MRTGALASALVLVASPAAADVVSWATEADVLAGTLVGVEVDGGGVLTVGASASWYDAAWDWRSPVTVTENSGRAVTDYSVQVTVDTAALVAVGRLEADGRDLRFTDAAGTLLDHWVESGMNTASTLIWVQVPSVAGGGTADLWMYHGNVAATDVSDKAATMLWWDDFSSGSLAGYTARGLDGIPADSWGVSGGHAHNQNVHYEHQALTVTGLTLDDDFLVETAAYTDDDDGLGIVSHVSGSGHDYYCVQTWESVASRNGICKSQTEGPAAVSAGLNGCCVGSTHTYRLTRVAGEIRFHFDGSLVATWTDSSPLAAGPVGMVSSDLDPAGYHDFILVRRYVEPEPSAVVGAAEQDSGGAGTWTSDVVDSGCDATTWDEVAWTESLPAGTDVELSVRTGPTATPDGGWTGWSAAVSDPAGSALAVAAGRYGQLQATLTGATAVPSPEASAFALTFTPAQDDDGDGDDVLGCGGADCDDGDATVYDGAPEACDDVDSDCDGDLVDGDADLDGDGLPDCVDDNADGDAYCDDVEGDGCDDPGDLVGDCDDLDAAVFPAGSESCDDVDSDCDGDLVDGFDDLDGDGLPDCVDDDADGDGWCEDLEGDGCDDPLDLPGDCDDLDATLSPGAAEACDSIDSDCDGDLVDGFPDLDGDGEPDCVDTDVDGDGVANIDDCDPLDATVYPGAPEICDGLDNDCDGVADPPDDDDGDGFFDAVCGGADCDDDDPTIHPDADEVCGDGIDQDCDGVDLATADLDGDGYSPCTGDCDDDDPTVSPDAEDVCNDTDDDCDGEVDEGWPEDCVPCDEQIDHDGDGFLECDGDCDEADAEVNPYADEVCDEVDNDCDGEIDEGFDGPCDEDGDGDGWTAGDGDCDDADPEVHPDADEACSDGVDSDCDGADGPAELDADGDRWASLECGGGDCDDTDPWIHPGEYDACGDGIDENCDGRDPTCPEIVLDGDGAGGGCEDCEAHVAPGSAPAAGALAVLVLGILGGRRRAVP